MTDTNDRLNFPDRESEYYETYFARIEELFAALRGRSILLSPNDYQLARGWFESGIPLSCVLRGIRQAFYKKMSEGEFDEDAILSLSWCKWAVKAEWKEYRKTAAEQRGREVSSGEFTADELEAILSSLSFDLRRAGDRAGGDAAELLAGAAETVSAIAEQESGEGEIEERLRALELSLRDSLWAAADAEDVKAVRRSVNRSLKKYRESMSSEAYERTHATACGDKLMQRLSVPRLSIYTL